MSSSNIYYVYAYLRSKDSKTAKAGTPYYIGKGKGRRAYDQSSHSIKAGNNKIVLLESNLSEIGAFAIERRLISWWGRKDLGTGILENRSDGGDGPSGMIPWHKGKTLPQWIRDKIAAGQMGREVTAETRQKISDAQKGIPRRIHSDETKAKMSKSQKKRPPDSAVTRLKKSLANIGNTHNLGKKLSEEHKAKLRKPKAPRSAEHCAKLSEAAKRRYQK